MQNWADIQSLLSNRVPESEILDYKRDCYGNSDSSKRELLKDVSSFANTRGGHIIIGVDEEEGVPTKIVGIDAEVNLDAETQRMVQVINSGFDPAFTSVQCRTIGSGEGTRCLVLDIPRSAIAPHRIAFGNYHRFFIRDSNGKHEATMPELRSLFTLSELGIQRFRDFSRERLDIISDPERDTTGIVKDTGLLIVHIVPQVLLLTDQMLNIDALYRDHYERLRAFSSPYGTSRRYNFDGFIVFSGGDKLYTYTQVFRNGVIEAAMGEIHKDSKTFGKLIPGITLERDFFETFPGYLRAYKDVNVPPPYIVQISLVGVRDAHYGYQKSQYGYDPQPRLDRDRMILRECMVESLDSLSDIHRGVKPAFDSLYNALDRPQCPHFSEEGIWQDPR